MTTHPKLDVPLGRVVGAIVCESLRPGTRLESPGLTMLTMSRYDLSEPGRDQPSRWTLIEFDGPEEIAERLARELSEILLVEGGWYANFSTSTEAFVVYASKIFRYDRETTSGREAALEYGRSVGVPEPQLDWPE